MLKRIANGCAAKVQTTAWRRAFSVLAAVSVLLGLLLLCAGSRMLPFQLEPLASTWNDEAGYYRTTQEILTGTIGQGVNGYNEQNEAGEGIAPWNISAFSGFVLFGKVLGMTDPSSIVAANVLFTIFGMAAFVWLAKPNGWQALLLTGYGAFNLLWCRYAWSGMCEAQYVALMLAFGGAMLYSQRKSTEKWADWALLAAGAAAGLAACSRAYYAAFMLMPLFALLMRRKWGFAAGQTVLIAGSAAEYFREAAQQVSYLQEGGSSTDKFGEMVSLLFQGRIGSVFAIVVEKNVQAARELFQGFLNGSENAYSTLVLVLLCIAFLVQGILRLRQKESALLPFGFVFISALIFEAMVVLYNAGQLGRHLLALDVLGCVLLICTARFRAGLAAVLLTPVLLVVCLRSEGLYSLRLPSRTQSTIEMRAELPDQFRQVMQFTPGDPWANTVVYDLNNTVWQPRLLMPAGFAGNTCDYTYIAPAIREHRLKSRYVYTARGLAADEACQQNGYPLLMETDQFTLYENTDYQKA